MVNELKTENQNKIKPYVSYASVCEKLKTCTKEKVAKDVVKLEKKQIELKELERKTAKTPTVRMTIKNLGNEIKQLQKDLDDAYARNGIEANEENIRSYMVEDNNGSVQRRNKKQVYKNKNGSM